MKSSILIAVAIVALVTSFAHAGNSICRLKDVNGDGVDDLALASRDTSLDERVWLLSGKDGALLREWKGDEPGAGFGVELAAFDDLDGDSREDLALIVAGGHRGNDAHPFVFAGLPCVCVVSTSTGKKLLEVLLKDVVRDETSLQRAGDWNADGVPDLAFTAADELRIVSGKDGRALVQRSQRGLTICMGDFDGDERIDICCGEPDAAFEPLAEEVKAGLTRQDATGAISIRARDAEHELARQRGDPTGAGYGYGTVVRALGDLDGDGRAEIAASAPSYYVRVVSWKKGELQTLTTIKSVRTDIMDDFGTTIDVAGDVDGDGHPDLVVGANESAYPGFFDCGYVRVWSVAKNASIAVIAYSSDEGIDVCSLGDVDRDGKPDLALASTALAPRAKLRFAQRVRAMNATGETTIWERSVAELRAGTPVKR